VAARRQALASNWDGTFESMYETYESHLLAHPAAGRPVLSVATS
jgi:hypothetical protein